MRKTLWAAALMLGFTAGANAAPQIMHKDGTVIAVNRGGKSPTVQSGFSNSTYTTTDHTIFRVGTAPAYHLDGRSPVADEVTIGG